MRKFGGEKNCTAGRATDYNMGMRFVFCISKATNTHSQFVILVFFLLQQWLKTLVINQLDAPILVL